MSLFAYDPDYDETPEAHEDAGRARHERKLKIIARRRYDDQRPEEIKERKPMSAPRNMTRECRRMVVESVLEHLQRIDDVIHRINSNRISRIDKEIDEALYDLDLVRQKVELLASSDAG